MRDRRAILEYDHLTPYAGLTLVVCGWTDRFSC